MKTAQNDCTLLLLQRIIQKLDETELPRSIKDVLQKIKQEHQSTTVLKFIRLQINQLHSAKRWGTARNYEKTLKSFSGFLHDHDIPFELMTVSLINEYNAYLIQRNIVRNSISFYMRNLRAIFNKAVRQQLIPFSNPFIEVYTGIDHTRKRSVDESVIQQLCHLDLSQNNPLALARDLFIFSYCTRGMAFVDIAHLKKSDIQNGMLYYTRHKTKQLLSVKIEPYTQSIINRYASPQREYLFPLISTDHPDKAYQQYIQALNTQNRLLKALSALLPGHCHLTSYTPRHSWATIARNHNIPLSVISAGLGHTSEQTTQIYLNMLENAVIDKANHELIYHLTR